MNAYAVLGYTLVPGALLFAGGVLLGMVLESWETLSLILASISIGLAIAIFAIQSSQNEKIKKITTDVNEITTQIQNLTEDIHTSVLQDRKIKNEIKEDVSFELNRKLDRSIRDLVRALNFNELYHKEENEKKKKNYQKLVFSNVKWLPKIIDLDIGTLEMMSIYGRDITKKYLNLLNTIRLPDDIFVNEDGEWDYEQFLDHKRGYLEDCRNLKKEIESFCVKSD